MKSRITYELDEQTLKKVLTETLSEVQTDAVLNRFTDRAVSAATVADIHGVHRDTVISYARAGLLPHTRQGKLYKFSLSEILQTNFQKLKHKKA